MDTCLSDLIADERYVLANDLIVPELTTGECIEYALFAARMVLPDFETVIMDDKRPREAVQAVEAVVEGHDKYGCHETARRASRRVAYAIGPASRMHVAYAVNCIWSAAWAASRTDNDAILRETVYTVRAALECPDKRKHRAILEYGLGLAKETDHA